MLPGTSNCARGQLWCWWEAEPYDVPLAGKLAEYSCAHNLQAHVAMQQTLVWDIM